MLYGHCTALYRATRAVINFTCAAVCNTALYGSCCRELAADGYYPVVSRELPYCTSFNTQQCPCQGEIASRRCILRTVRVFVLTVVMMMIIIGPCERAADATQPSAIRQNHESINHELVESSHNQQKTGSTPGFPALSLHSGPSGQHRPSLFLLTGGASPCLAFVALKVKPPQPPTLNANQDPTRTVRIIVIPCPSVLK